MNNFFIAGIWIILHCTVVSFASSSAAVELRKISAKISFHNGEKYDIYVRDAYSEFNITLYPRWESIIEFEVSRDNKYLFALHRRNNKVSNILSVYNIEKRALIREIKPGFGGDFQWVIGNKILHTWGCGTNCYSIHVYDTLLSEIPLPKMTANDMSGDFVLSPKRSNMTFISMYCNSYSILDLHDMKEITHRNYQRNYAIKYVRYRNDSTLTLAAYEK